MGIANNELLVNVGQINRISARIYCRLPPAPRLAPLQCALARTPCRTDEKMYMTVCLLARLNANKWRCMMTMGTVVTVNGCD